MKKKNAGQIPHGAWLTAALAALLLTGCGGGGGSSSGAGSGNSNASSAAIVESGSPAATGDTATDGINWFNYRRSQMGLAPLARNVLIDKAALNHSNYQAASGFISHEEVQGKNGFTGVYLYPSAKAHPELFRNGVPVSGSSRLSAAGYALPSSGYAFGEVIAKTPDASGFNSAEALITAIYHRFVVFEPKFQQAGAGSAKAADGYVYFTADFTTPALASGGLGAGRFLPYPYPNQTNLPTVFQSDQEEPDPVPNQNEVGYPVSVHADNTSTITVGSFTIAPRGGAPLATRLLSSATDAETGPSTAAIIPLTVLNPQTTYDVRFSGAVDGVAASLSWSFSTR
ncbi:CAP domain-containing protein [Noviherbaspirillum pedocola]|uniref:CAP domain-containing protein n=1 Tax=Noviherbaspirillum pedocola TaxID=2801341 RepID=A0A934W788_9BURK|nr:CAP domain-containing protein [Noviherbaspirillum pedocola]MBK4737127.1 CAP domain-containing protein [Noviherbaspirillum pedocola]